MNKLLTALLLIFSIGVSLAQEVILEGYVYEEGNRGYLNTARVLVEETATGDIAGETYSNIDGYFSIEVEANTAYTLHVSKDFFEELDKEVTTGSEKTFVKVEMMREQGYMFEITLADKKQDEEFPTDGIRNTRIEVYNNTTKEEVLVIEDHPEPEFRIHMKDGNHYTVLVRKDGYFAKKMEAFVNVNGCIMCFEGIGSVTPGVADNLTSGNNSGVLLANVEMDKVFTGKSLKIENLYYDLDKAFLRKDAKKELDKVVTLFNYNPRLTIELGSHTDSRGSDDYNLDLSKRRAESAVQYLIREGGINSSRISSRGYGETRLTNECANNVNCTEEQHQQNRRTELTIVGIGEKMEYIPLAEMKRREELEQLAITGQLGEQVTGEQLNQILNAEDLEKIPSENVNQEKVKAAGDKTVAKHAKMEESTTEMKDETKSNASVTKPIILNGPAIVLHEGTKRITKDHELYQEHKDLKLFELPNKTVWYMLTGFASKQAAQAQLDEERKMGHPGAFLVEFKNGKLVK